jgi:hypothetical protein
VVAKHGRQGSKECRQNIEHWITKEEKLTSIISGGLEFTRGTVTGARDSWREMICSRDG